MDPNPIRLMRRGDWDIETQTEGRWCEERREDVRLQAEERNHRMKSTLINHDFKLVSRTMRK